MLSIVFSVVISNFFQHLVDASLVQSSLLARLGKFKGMYYFGGATDRKTLLILLKYRLAFVGRSSASQKL
jgi:hypothetical protein